MQNIGLMQKCVFVFRAFVTALHGDGEVLGDAMLPSLSSKDSYLVLVLLMHSNAVSTYSRPLCIVSK